MLNKLQKKFHRSEVKSGSPSKTEDAAEIIKQVKSLKKSTELPPPLPAEAMVSDFDLMVAEISRSLRVIFTSVRFEDEKSIYGNSSLTVEFLHALTKVLGLHNTTSMFEGEDNIFCMDINSKDFFVYISMALAHHISEKEIYEYVQSVQRKINTQLRPYGSTCKIQYSEDLIRSQTNLNFIFYINRLENFSNNEEVESTEVKRSAQGEMRA